MSYKAIRTIFVCAVAFVGAVAGDALIEGLSNSQLLWRGNYTDHSSADLLPMSIVAGLTVAVVLALFLKHRLGTWKPATRALVLAASRALAARGVVRLIPAIYLLQLATLFGMESIEQVAVYGHLFGGTVWLGGPVAVSLCAHLVIAAVFTLALARCLTVLADMLAYIVGRILAHVLARSRERVALGSRTDEPHGERYHVWSARTGERGPPTPILVRI